jgi:hypothetical protein
MIKLVDCDFLNNQAYMGGALCTFQTSVDLTRCNMFENKANGRTSDCIGGAIFTCNFVLALTGSDDVLQPRV